MKEPLKSLPSRTDKIIDEWYNTTEKVTRQFVKKYFPHEVYGEDTFWVGDEIGSVFCVGERFFNLDRIIEALTLKATRTELYKYYDWEVDHCYVSPHTAPPINFKNYIKNKFSLPKIEKMEIANFVEERFNKIFNSREKDNGKTNY